MVYQNDANIHDLEARKGELNRQGTYARNNTAGATYLSGIRQEIGQLDLAIAQERSRITQENARVNSAYRSAIADCDKAKVDLAASRSN